MRSTYGAILRTLATSRLLGQVSRSRQRHSAAPLFALLSHFATCVTSHQVVLVLAITCFALFSPGCSAAPGSQSPHDASADTGESEDRCRELLLSRRAHAAQQGSARSKSVSTAPLTVFADSSAGQKAVIDQSVDWYFAKLGETEIWLKSGIRREGRSLSEIRDEYRIHYCASVKEFSTSEMNLLSSAVNELQPFLAVEYPLTTASPWHFLKIDSSVEGGLPHTIGGSIVFPDRFLEQLASRAEEGGNAVSAVGYWLLHERLHIAQRSNRDRFHRLYEVAWNFRYVEELERGDWLEARQLTNPDCGTGYWLQSVGQGNEVRWIWPAVILDRASPSQAAVRPPGLEDSMINIAAEVLLEDGRARVRVGPSGRPEYGALSSIPGYSLPFPFGVAFPHPDEIAASAFARIAVEDFTNGEHAFRSVSRDQRWKIIDLRIRFKDILGAQ